MTNTEALRASLSVKAECFVHPKVNLEDPGCRRCVQRFDRLPAPRLSFKVGPADTARKRVATVERQQCGRAELREDGTAVISPEMIIRVDVAAKRIVVLQRSDVHRHKKCYVVQWSANDAAV